VWEGDTYPSFEATMRQLKSMDLGATQTRRQGTLTANDQGIPQQVDFQILLQDSR
jgi:hypothetical protein